ncbi:hypothetical protein VDGL01_11337 [Verticillium dahliae]
MDFMTAENSEKVTGKSPRNKTHRIVRCESRCLSHVSHGPGSLGVLRPFRLLDTDCRPLVRLTPLRVLSLIGRPANDEWIPLQIGSNPRPKSHLLPAPYLLEAFFASLNGRRVPTKDNPHAMDEPARPNDESQGRASCRLGPIRELAMTGHMRLTRVLMPVARKRDKASCGGEQERACGDGETGESHESPDLPSGCPPCLTFL